MKCEYNQIDKVWCCQKITVDGQKTYTIGYRSKFKFIAWAMCKIRHDKMLRLMKDNKALHDWLESDL